MEKSRREKLIQLYSIDPSVLPASEVKPLKFSGKDKFANTMEINLDMAGSLRKWKCRFRTLAFSKLDGIYKKCSFFNESRGIKN
jgi:hypothetical protein